MRRAALAAAVLGAISIALAHSALAQDVATAQALFEQGKKLMAEKKYTDACPKLEESQRLDPGGGTLFALALCHEGQGRTATAWGDFNLALSQARKDSRADRERAAQEHIRALEPKLSRLTVNVAQPLPGIEITRDGTQLHGAEWGTPLPVDPGDHEIRASAPGKNGWHTTVAVVGEGKTVEVTVPPLEGGAAPPASAPTAASAPPASTTPAPPPASASATAPTPAPTGGGGSAQKTIGFVVGGIGIVGIGVGSFFGLRSFSNWSDAQSACKNNTCPSATSSGFSSASSAKTDADVSTIAFAAGGVALAVGAVLVFTAPGRTESPAALRVTPMVARDGAGISVRGAL